MAIEDDWMNCIDDYDIWIMNYYRMILQLAEKVLNLEVSLKEWNKDTTDVMDLLYNRDKIYECPS